MSKTREKKLVIAGVTREKAEEAFAAYAIADARQQKITARMDIDISKIREKYQEDLNALQEQKDQTFELMQVFATEQKDVLFGKKKSMEMVHGILGFRTGTPKLKTRKGFTWPSVTNLLKEFLPSYVRTSEEPAKDKLLADREIPEVLDLFPKVGIFVDQDETFFVEPKKEEMAVA
jgi:phage host-nuclease inhibitor protein Gam